MLFFLILGVECPRDYPYVYPTDNVCCKGYFENYENDFGEFCYGRPRDGRCCGNNITCPIKNMCKDSKSVTGQGITYIHISSANENVTILYIMSKLQIQSLTLSSMYYSEKLCPPQCKCHSGLGMGGVPLGHDAYCHYYCSQKDQYGQSFCGSSKIFTEGNYADCTKCGRGKI